MSRIRKKWLISFLAFISVNIALIVMILATGTEDNRVSAIISLICLPIWSWIIYHCAYRKRGTAWLLFIMIYLPLNLLKKLVEGINEGWLTFEIPTLIIFLRFYAVILICYGWFWCNCYRYRKENLFLIKTSEKGPKRKRLFGLIRKFANPDTALKRGFHRIGLVLGFFLSGVAFIFCIFCTFIEGFYKLHISLLVTLLFMVIFFLIPVLLAKGLGWIVEGFQKTGRSICQPTSSLEEKGYD